MFPHSIPSIIHPCSGHSVASFHARNILHQGHKYYHYPRHLLSADQLWKREWREGRKKKPTTSLTGPKHSCSGGGGIEARPGGRASPAENILEAIRRAIQRPLWLRIKEHMDNAHGGGFRSISLAAAAKYSAPVLRYVVPSPGGRQILPDHMWTAGYVWSCKKRCSG